MQISFHALLVELRNQRADGTFLARPESGDDFPFGKAPSGKRCDRLLESGDAERQRISDGSVEIEQNGLEHVLKIPVILYCAKP